MSPPLAVAPEGVERGFGLAGRDPDGADAGRLKELTNILLALHYGCVVLAADAQGGLEHCDGRCDRNQSAVEEINEGIANLLGVELSAA